MKVIRNDIRKSNRIYSEYIFVIPKKIVRILGYEKGDEVIPIPLDNGDLLLKRVKKGSRDE